MHSFMHVTELQGEGRVHPEEEVVWVAVGPVSIVQIGNGLYVVVLLVVDREALHIGLQSAPCRPVEVT
jgi:hypothetical protein